jgi:hypothetical protein
MSDSEDSPLKGVSVPSATDLLVELGLPAIGFGTWFAAYAAARSMTRADRVTPAPAAPDLGPESPAVVSLFANRWEFTEDAAEATLLDLAARRYLEFRQAGNDPRHTTVHLTGKDPADLNPYERLVFDRVLERATGGVVPLTALTFTNAGLSVAFAKRLRVAVVAEARTKGLSRRRYSAGWLTIFAVLAVFAGLLVAAVIVYRDQDYGAAAGGALVTAAALITLASRLGGERDTPAGRAAAQRWLGVRDWLQAHPEFANLPPAAVATWDRYLSYGAALGTTRVASQIIELGLADRRRIWSSYGGRWRRVTIRYPTRPKSGFHWGYLILRAAIMVMVGWTFASPGEVFRRLFDASMVTVVFTLFGLVLLVWGGYLVVRLGLDFAQPASVTGEVLWTQVWKQRSRENGPDEPTLYYLAVDEGREDRTVAWVIPAALADTCRTGDELRLRVRPWTRWVTAVEMVRKGPEWAAWEGELARGTLRDNTETLVAAAMRPTGDAVPPSLANSAPASAVLSALAPLVAAVQALPGLAPVAAVAVSAAGDPEPWVRPGELISVAEVSRALGGAALTAFVAGRGADVAQLAGFDSAGGRALEIEVSRAEPAAQVIAERRSGTALPNIGDESYSGADWVTSRRGDAVIDLRLGPAAPAGAATFLPWLLHTAVGRLPTPSPALARCAGQTVRGSRVAALPRADTDLVAFGVGHHPERGCFGVVAQDPAGGDGRVDAAGRLVVRDRYVEVDAVALRPWRIHLLEPDRRTLPERVRDRILRAGRPGLVVVTQHRLPERPDRGDVERVDRDLERLDRPSCRISFDIRVGA